MTFGIRDRLVAFALGIVLMTVLIAWAATTSWQELVRLQQQLSRSQLISFEVADRLQSGVLELNNLAIAFDLRAEQPELDAFLHGAQQLEAWIEATKGTLTSRLEKNLLLKTAVAFGHYVQTVTNVAANIRSASYNQKLGGIEEVNRQSVQLLGLGYQLADAHRLVLENVLSSSRASVSILQRLIFASLAVLLILEIWLASTVYRDMIAPLRTKLYESQAIIARQEKLASLGTLAAGVAHEIRNPLTAIKARLYAQLEGLNPGAQEYGDAVFIGNEINRLEKIVKDFLLFARPSEAQPVKVAAGDLVKEVHALMAHTLTQQSIRLIVDVPLQVMVKIDPQQLKQVLINLVQNAADSIGHDGTVTLRVRVDAHLLPAASEAIVIEVIDTGKGISPEAQKRLFDPFFTTKPGGTGLGLSIAARLIEKNGGVLQYQTKVNRGSIFRVVLPRAENV